MFVRTMRFGMVRLAGAAEGSVGEGDLDRVAEEAHGGVGVDAARAGEDLERDVRSVELDDLRERRAGTGVDLRNFAVLHALGAKRRDGAGKRVDAMVDL